MDITCEQFRTIQTPSGHYKTERCYSYVALLCEKGGKLTDGVRVDYCKNKAEAAEKVKFDYGEDWNIKGIWRLYDEDFEDKPEKPVPDSLAAFMNPPEGGEK